MRTYPTFPELPSGYALSPCRGMWSIVVPAAATNLITNPSGELSTDGYTISGAAISRATTEQRHGVYSLAVTPSVDVGSIDYTITLAPDTTYTWSVDVLGAPGVPYRLRVYDDTVGQPLSSTSEFRGTGRWERQRLSFHTGAGSVFLLFVEQAGGGVTSPWYTDGWQLCELPYDTTYIDGDQPGCSWSGLRHASLSSRSAQSRRGGRIVELDAYGFVVTGEIGLGMQPAEDITTPTGLLGGALYQRTVQRVRPFSLIGQFTATSFVQLQRLRAELHAALSPFGVAEQQPIVLRYRAIDGARPIGEELELLCHYTGGLEGNTDNLYGERAAIGFTMYLPLIQSVGDAGATFDAAETITDADYIVERDTAGVWHALNGGLSGPLVAAAVYGPDGTLYVAGDFTTAYNAAGTGDPVTVNNIARWDGTSWSALGDGLNNDVQVLAFDAAGNLYAGGIFTDADYPYLAMWDGTTWSVVGLDTDGTGPVHALAFDGDGNLFVGGAFTDWGGLSGADRIARWDGASWDVPGGGTGADGTIYTLTYDSLRDSMIAGGAFTQIDGESLDHVASFDLFRQQWLAMGQGLAGDVYATGLDAANRIYAGGAFTASGGPSYVAQRDSDFSSHQWGPLAGDDADLDDSVFAMTVIHPGGAILFGGAFGTAGGLTFADSLAVWSGSAWSAPWIDLPGLATVYALASHADGRLAVGYDTSGSATSATTDTTVVNTGSAPAAPVFTITGPGRLESIVNWTSGKSISLNLMLQDGETLTIDLTPGAVSVLSTFRGNLGGSILSGSDLASWRLLPGVNTIVARADMAVLMRWRSVYTSLAGAVS